MNKELLKRIKLLPDVIASIFYLRFYKLLSPWFNIKPKRVQIALTYQCNSRCIMCNIWKMKEFSKISVKNWNKILNDPIFSEIKYIDITGGEALLHPDFTDLINIFVKKLPKLKKINLVSNGFLTSKSKKNLESLISYLDRKKIALGIAVSLDGYGKMHEEIRGIPQAFEKVSQTLSDLKKLQDQYPNFTIYVGILIMKKNLNKTQKLTDWLEKNNFKYGFQIVGFHDSYIRNLDTKNEIDFSKKDEEKLFKFLKEKKKAKDIVDFYSYYWADLLSMYRDKNKRTTPCPFLQDSFAVDALGDIYYCFSSKAIGNIFNHKKEINKNSVSQIYFNPENKIKRKEMWQKDCANCNSGCDINVALAADFKKYFWFRLTGKIMPRLSDIFKKKNAKK